jgi:hypothetical protein
MMQRVLLDYPFTLDKHKRNLILNNAFYWPGDPSSLFSRLKGLYSKRVWETCFGPKTISNIIGRDESSIVTNL